MPELVGLRIRRLVDHAIYSLSFKPSEPTGST